MKLTLENLPMYCTEVGQCLLWNLGCSGTGYPIARLDGKAQGVRGYVFRLTGRELKTGYRIVARCGNPLCLSPACLRAWTYSQMNSHTYAKGSRRGEYRSRRDKAIRQGITKLNQTKAREIRARAANESQSALAREFNVHRTCIADVLNNRTWREVHAAASVFAQEPARRAFAEAA
jgi:hypothetical protein